jgi:hypothetical protein
MDFSSSFMVFRPLTMTTIKFEPFFLPQPSTEWPSNKGPLGDFVPKFIPIVYGQPNIFILESQYLCIIVVTNGQGAIQKQPMWWGSSVLGV